MDATVFTSAPTDRSIVGTSIASDARTDHSRGRQAMFYPSLQDSVQSKLSRERSL